MSTRLRLKIRREKSDIVYDYSELIVECAVVFYERYCTTAAKGELTAFMLIIDFLIIEIFYKVTVLSKFALYEISQKIEDSTLQLFGGLRSIEARYRLKPSVSINILDFAPKVSA